MLYRMSKDNAEAIRRGRLSRGWSKEEAARIAGISSITWKRIEDGLSVQEASLAKAFRAIDDFGVETAKYVSASGPTIDVGALSDSELYSVLQQALDEARRRSGS